MVGLLDQAEFAQTLNDPNQENQNEINSLLYYFSRSFHHDQRRERRREPGKERDRDQQQVLYSQRVLRFGFRSQRLRHQ
jgi:hypothetical protein